MKFYLKYIQGNYVPSDAIHLDLGNLLHKALEIKYRNVIEGKETDFTQLLEMIQTGIKEETEKGSDEIAGINKLIDKYGYETFAEINAKSNLSYNQKLETFYTYLVNDRLEEDWKPLAVELPFEFVYEDRIILHGFIDRIDINSKGEIRVVDYKSSNKVFEHKDLTTPLQMFIYTLACEQIYNKTPVSHVYDMILLGEKQNACTKGYYKRAKKKLDKILQSIDEDMLNGLYKPKPTPLCHWCDYSKSNPSAPFYTEDLCEYYSLWTPDNKTFETNKKFGEKEVEELDF